MLKASPNTPACTRCGTSMPHGASMQIAVDKDCSKEVSSGSAQLVSSGQRRARKTRRGRACFARGRDINEVGVECMSARLVHQLRRGGRALRFSGDKFSNC